MDGSEERVEPERLGQDATIPGGKPVVEIVQELVVRRADEDRDRSRDRMTLEPLEQAHPIGLVVEAQVKEDQAGSQGGDCLGCQVRGGEQGEVVPLLL